MVCMNSEWRMLALATLPDHMSDTLAPISTGHVLSCWALHKYLESFKIQVGINVD